MALDIRKAAQLSPQTFFFSAFCAIRCNIFSLCRRRQVSFCALASWYTSDGQWRLHGTFGAAWLSINFRIEWAPHNNFPYKQKETFFASPPPTISALIHASAARKGGGGEKALTHSKIAPLEATVCFPQKKNRRIKFPCFKRASPFVPNGQRPFPPRPMHAWGRSRIGLVLENAKKLFSLLLLSFPFSANIRSGREGGVQQGKRGNWRGRRRGRGGNSRVGRRRRRGTVKRGGGKASAEADVKALQPAPGLPLLQGPREERKGKNE